ncbi:MAG: type II toxin-antitoxin system RelE/ParE family toxin [Candidatus Omnitrophota bacterium]
MEEDKLSCVYYFIDERGGNPVRDFIESLAVGERAKVLAYINELKKQGNNLRRPMAGHLGCGIYELRPKDNRIFYFFYLKNSVVLVHAIKKRVREIPRGDLNICFKRKAMIETGCNHIGR